MPVASKYKQRRAAGLCTNCPAQAQPKMARCLPCHEKDLKGKEGRCRTCGVSSETARCDLCREKLRTDYHQRVRDGQCVICRNPATTGAFCFRHWLKNIGSAYGLNFKNGGLQMLERLWKKQAGVCAVTWIRLIPGVNASLDHVIPVSRGGHSVESNLRWVLLGINRAKMDLTHDEFVELCTLVVNIEGSKPGYVVDPQGKALSEITNKTPERVAAATAGTKARALAMRGN